MVEVPNEYVMKITDPGQELPTRPTYDYQSAIQRRLEPVDAIGDGANQYAKQLADRRVQASMQAAQDRISQMQQDTQIKAAHYNGGGGFVKGQPVADGTSPDGSMRNKLVQGAAAFKGVDYVWGGESPKGFDCSGLIQYVYGKMGVNMPRVSQQQATQGKVTPITQLQQGDFVAWGNSPATAHHIAIYAGNGMVWEAPHTGAQVRLRKISPSEAGIMGIHLNL